MKKLLLAAGVALGLSASPVRAHIWDPCNGFFHTQTYCAYLQDANWGDEPVTASVYLDHNETDVYNRYLVSCADRWVEKVTPPRRRNQTSQASQFDNALWRLICD